jgi:hypothetical protein
MGSCYRIPTPQERTPNRASSQYAAWMPAECEIKINNSACGVLAIGRCVDCYRPFCGAHTAHQPPNSFNNLCQPCLDARQMEGVEQAAARKSLLQAAPQRIEAAADRLVGSSLLPSARSYKTLQKRFLRWVDVEISLEPAWPLGHFIWQQPETQRQGWTEGYRTGVTPSGLVVPMEVPTDAEQAGLQRPTALKDETSLLRIAEKIERIAAEQGV